MGLFDRAKKNSGTSGGANASSENQGTDTEHQKTEDTPKGARSILEKKDQESKDGSQDDEDEELKNTKVYFKLDLRPQIVQIPDYKDHTKINVKYDLIPPHCSCHIFWDNKQEELIYYVDEPELDDMEREILRLVTLGLEEMINISFINAAKNKKVVQYLEHNVQSILGELGTRVSMETYQKLMYYIYRDFIGLNEIEPLLRDYYIEDIECNGAGFPIYVVHRKFRNVHTNIIFKDRQHLSEFVEKLSQKCGRYVSYAQPILDGSLADGSRVNATYSEDVTTRGPTFTIRKFTKDPWMPTSLIRMKTASPEVFAYLWLCVEHKLNMITIGETGSGKTTLLNSLASYIPAEARIGSIEDTRELNIAHDNWLPSVTRDGFGVTNLTGEKYGEITLFDLLKESFRQNPDYVIVGEVRDKETYVLFQGMASGHSCFSTFHASSVDALVKRLTTPPISLPASLVESMNVVIHMNHMKVGEHNVRRLRQVDEILDVKENGDVSTKTPFTYNPTADDISMKTDIYALELISKIIGVSTNDVMEELNTRAKLLQKLAESNVVDYKEFTHIVNEYYSNPKAVLQRYGISATPLYDKKEGYMNDAQASAVTGDRETERQAKQ
ncbi:MAG: type II/IV secretion system ATPase subunit [Candidatus Woesearchaeota archaeon]